MKIFLNESDCPDSQELAEFIQEWEFPIDVLDPQEYDYVYNYLGLEQVPALVLDDETVLHNRELIKLQMEQYYENY